MGELENFSKFLSFAVFGLILTSIFMLSIILIIIPSQELSLTPIIPATLLLVNNCTGYFQLNPIPEYNQYTHNISGFFNNTCGDCCKQYINITNKFLVEFNTINSKINNITLNTNNSTGDYTMCCDMPIHIIGWTLLAIILIICGYIYNYNYQKNKNYTVI